MLSTEHEKSVKRNSSRFHDHEGISFDHVKNWLVQFQKSKFDLASKILDNITYFSGREIRGLTNKLIDKVFQYYKEKGIKQKDIYFVPIGYAGDGSFVVARALRNTGRVHPSKIISSLREIEALKSESIK